MVTYLNQMLLVKTDGYFSLIFKPENRVPKTMSPQLKHKHHITSITRHNIFIYKMVKNFRIPFFCPKLRVHSTIFYRLKKYLTLYVKIDNFSIITLKTIKILCLHLTTKHKVQILLGTPKSIHEENKYPQVIGPHLLRNKIIINY